MGSTREGGRPPGWASAWATDTSALREFEPKVPRGFTGTGRFGGPDPVGTVGIISYNCCARIMSIWMS